jgi:hypothetical protein
MSNETGKRMGDRTITTGAGSLGQSGGLGYDDLLPAAGAPDASLGSMSGRVEETVGGEDFMNSGSRGQSMSGSESSGGSETSGTSEKVSSGLNTGMSKAAEGLDRVVETVRGKTEGMGDNQLSSAATMAADRMASGAEALRSMDGEEMITSLESMIRQKPLESLLAAAGIGFVLSRAL